jgi:hypothetical protein
LKLTAAEGDFVGERDRDIGIGTQGIHALNHVLDNGFHLRVGGQGGQVQHFGFAVYIYLCILYFLNTYACNDSYIGLKVIKGNEFKKSCASNIRSTKSTRDNATRDNAIHAIHGD